MRLRRLSSWFLPTLGGSLGSAWIGTTLVGIFGPIDPLLGNRLWNWVASMAVTTVLTMMRSGLLLMTDLALLKWREIPVGRRACWMSASAPVLLALLYWLHRPGGHDGPLLLVALLLPMAIVALLTRWYGGTPRSGSSCTARW